MSAKYYLTAKRIFDIAISVFAILLLSPLWAVIAVVIKLSSKGPVLYKVPRVGLNGRVFVLYKFRTMRLDSGRIRSTTLVNDARIFLFGRFLRKTKLDETPQFINVLMGDMSIIGPRPEDKANAQWYYAGKYKKLLSVRPGLSSLASLYDYTHGEHYANEKLYAEHFLPEKLKLELYYIKHRSAVYDIKIVMKTIITIILVCLGKTNFKKPSELLLLNNQKEKI